MRCDAVAARGKPRILAFLRGEFLLIFAMSLGGDGWVALRRALRRNIGNRGKGDGCGLRTGLFVTMTGLVLWDAVSSAKTYYDGQKNVIARDVSEIILLDGLFD